MDERDGVESCGRDRDVLVFVDDERRVGGSQLCCGAEAGVADSGEGVSVNARGERRHGPIGAGVSCEVEVVQQGACGVGALGCGIVPVVNPVGAEAGVLVEGDAAGGVDTLPWCFAQAELVVDRYSFWSVPG